MEIRVNNFRSLVDTSYINLKPITVLVGKNSSGKSSFLRVLPLLKQSVEEKTKSPLLLCGRYVDFGSYKDILPVEGVRENAGAEQFELSFKLVRKTTVFPQTTKKSNDINIGCESNEVEVVLRFAEDKEDALQVSSIDLFFFNNHYSIEFDVNDGVVLSEVVNGEDVVGNEILFFISSLGIVPTVYKLLKSKSKKKGDESSNGSIAWERDLEQKITHNLGKYCRSGTSSRRLLGIVKGLRIDTDINMLNQLKRVEDPVTWHRKVSGWTVNDKEFVLLKNLLFHYFVQAELLPSFSYYLGLISSNVKYIAPFRATAERYYRIQHLDVNEVDPQGKNLPMFLGSLSQSQLKLFSSWTNETFGFTVWIHRIEGHYSIKIGFDNELVFNLSDIGFGYSQILPIITQIWYSVLNKSKNENRFVDNSNCLQIIAIEQPELHLHPKFQAKFADAISKIIKSLDPAIGVSLVIETHSDTIINRLGECIQEGELEPKHVEIAIFDKKDASSKTVITKSKFDEDGTLVNWPFGFFNPDFK